MRFFREETYKERWRPAGAGGKETGAMAQKEAKEKPLEKMTAKELRDLVMETEEVVGASGMNKAELIAAIREVRGIEAPQSRRKKGDVRELKKKIREIKAKREAALEQDDDRMANIYRKKIIRLKKKTRRLS